MGFSDFFGFKPLLAPSNSELPNLFALAIESDDFTETDVFTIYHKILTDCVDRIQGIPEELEPLLWDNCLQNQYPDGLITLIADAMTNTDDLFLIYNESLGFIRLADDKEAEKIVADYESKGESDLGIYISFKNYLRTDMVKTYSSMEYAVVSSLNKMVNLSKAIQFKMSQMRGAVSLNDAEIAINQAKAMAQSLGRGKDILLDKDDEIFTGTPDISSIKESIMFLDAKKCFYYGMPLSYINGEQTTGIGTTGEADSKAVERGLKQYFISILKPVLEEIFEIKVSFKSNDFRQIGSALEAIKTFELVSDDLLSQRNKQLIISKLFDVELEQSNE